ncbi:MAG: FAD binding domain-containing protein [Bryobacteraceae bacterium]
MQAFEFASPTSVKEALGLLGAQFSDAQLLAGGTDQISLLKERLHHPKRVVSLRNVKELHGIKKTGGGIRIGAMATVDEVMESSLVRAEYPSLVQAARGIASPQIRNMGTMGGDLCQRTRCWYYRNHLGLLAMKDGKSLVAEGQNEYHAIFGNSGPAKFVSASSFGPALVALGATVTVVSPSGSRSMKVADLFHTPKERGERETVLKSNEIITEILVPSARGVKNATYEVRQKQALDWPLVAASVALTMKGNSVGSAMVVLGHVAPTPHMASAAASMLSGKSITEDVAAQAGAAAAQGATPLSGNTYKVDLVKVAVKRALLAAVGA